MTTASTRNVRLGFVYQLFKAVQSDNLNYIYRGYFDHVITESILSLAETNIVDKEEKSSVKKRVYHIMVESLQNITRHQSVSKAKKIENAGVFFIQKKDYRYFVTTGNLIKNNLINDLRSKLDMVNSLSHEELKKYYKEKLIHGELSEKGGAGLGLIDMARKSGNKLLYDFKQIDGIFSYFYLHTEIPSTAFVKDIKTKTIQSYSLKHITALHGMLNHHDVLVVFNSYFNQESLMHLLSIVESHVSDKKSTKKKIFSIIVEMFQNIVHHGLNPKENEAGNPGMFFISESEDLYMLNTGNYIVNENTASLKTKLEHLNSLDNEALDDHYNRTLLDFDVDTKTEAGLGFIDMRIKSKNRLNFNFRKVTHEYSFFTLQISLNRSAME